MLNLKKIAVIGDLASGKSSTCNFFKKKGLYVLSCDDIVHNLLSSNITVKKQIEELFNSEIITNNQIDREKLAEKAFSNSEKLEKLEKIIHPHVFKTIESQFKKECRKNSNGLFIVEFPLLFETGHQKDYDIIIYVSADKNICKQNWKKKNKRIEEYEKRENRFIPSKEKIKKSDYVIENNSSLEDLEKKVLKLIKIINQKQISRR
jgi:dephospho-CoA kinase